MFISCSSCNSKYLVNSADLKPNGRNVQCAKCGHNWFQTSSFSEEDPIISAPTSSTENSKKNINNKNQNLPSTYVKEKEVSVINSLLVIVLIIGLIAGFWLYKNEGSNFLIFIYYYTEEFYFNLKLIINDLAKIVHQIFG